MGEEGLKCTLAECKARFLKIDKMNISELNTYSEQCSNCGNWILKEHKIAQKTYRKVSLKWAEEFNKQT